MTTIIESMIEEMIKLGHTKEEAINLVEKFMITPAKPGSRLEAFIKDYKKTFGQDEEQKDI